MFQLKQPDGVNTYRHLRSNIWRGIETIRTTECCQSSLMCCVTGRCQLACLSGNICNYKPVQMKVCRKPFNLQCIKGCMHTLIVVQMTQSNVFFFFDCKSKWLFIDTFCREQQQTINHKRPFYNVTSDDHSHKLNAVHVNYVKTNQCDICSSRYNKDTTNIKKQL